MSNATTLRPVVTPRRAPARAPAARGFFGSLWLALVDTAVISPARVPEGRWMSVLFHELVHLQQFQALGVSKLVARYVHGLFANGFNYPGLPMERQAENLQFRYDAGLMMFSVEMEVGRAIMTGAI